MHLVPHENVMYVHPIALIIASEARCSPTVSLQLLEANSGGATWVFECLLHPKEDVPFEKLLILMLLYPYTAHILHTYPSTGWLSK